MARIEIEKLLDPQMAAALRKQEELAPGLGTMHDTPIAELRRSYSICAGVDDGCLQVGIKRVDGGAFSTWANENLAPGDMIEAMPPMGKFSMPLDPDTARHYVGFAAGSGITPLTGRTISGEVPQVTWGSMAAASMCTSRSNTASSSLTSSHQASTARSHSSPVGA